MQAWHNWAVYWVSDPILDFQYSYANSRLPLYKLAYYCL